MEETTILRGNIYTMDPARPQAEALAWRNENIIAVGSAAEVEVAAGSGPRVIDVRDRVVIPGLIDSHIHFLWYSLGLQNVDLDGVRSLDESLELVRARAEKTAPKGWVRGGGWNNNLWQPNNFPTRQDLDRVSPNNPAYMNRKDGHSVWVNSMALQMAGITRDTPDPDGGRIGRDADGEPDGILYEGAAIGMVSRLLPESGEAEHDAALREGFSHALAAGLTGFHDCEGPDSLAAFQRMQQAGELPMRVCILLAYATLRESIAVGLRTGFGNNRLRLGPVKIFSDGSLGSMTAQMLAPFEGTIDNYGVATIPQDELEEAIITATRAGIPAAVHAIGDAANRRVLDAFALARQAEIGRDLPTSADTNGYNAYRLRHRIEHAQIVDPADWGRFRELGVIASMQPIHATSDMEAADRLWGARASNGAYAIRSLKRAGARVAFGSDCPVETLRPLIGIHAAVTRQDSAGNPPGGWHPHERISVQDAVRGYTRDAAYASGEEGIKGMLQAGKLADMVLLDRDIFTIDPMEIATTGVNATIVGGEIVYGEA